MDNDVPNILEWDTIERRCRGGEIQVVRVPLVGSIYKKVQIYKLNDLQSFFGWKFTIHDSSFFTDIGLASNND